MKNEDAWLPSKFDIAADGRVRASSRQQDLSISSYLAAELTAQKYTRLIPTYVRGDLLDLGCGKAPLAGLYRRFASSTTCADWPQTLHADTYLDVFCDLTQPLPFVDSAFDTVLLSDVLEHLPDPETAFREIARVLRPAGVLLLNTPFMYWVHEAPHDYYRHTKYSLERLAHRAGLTAIEIEPVGGVVDVLIDVTAKGLSAVPLAGRPLAWVLQRLTLAISRRGLLKASRQASGGLFPLAHVLVAAKPL